MSDPERLSTYDVAFSFRAGNLQLALWLKDQLEPSLRCFVYSRAQEEIAGTDGLDTFRTVFRRQSRLNVVLLSDGWGLTPWTGVEEAAIRDAALQARYRNMMIVRLDSIEVPAWVPDTHQLFDLTTYPREQLIGAIKARAQELGATVIAETAIDRARRQITAEKYERETDSFFDSLDGVEAFDNAVAEVQSAVVRRAEAVAKIEPDWGPKVQPGVWSFDMRFAGQRLRVEWQRYQNSARDCRITAECLTYVSGLHDWAVSRTDRLEITRAQGTGVCWRLSSSGTKFFTADDLADRWIDHMVEMRRTTSQR